MWYLVCTPSVKYTCRNELFELLAPIITSVTSVETVRKWAVWHHESVPCTAFSGSFAYIVDELVRLLMLETTESKHFQRLVSLSAYLLVAGSSDGHVQILV